MLRLAILEGWSKPNSQKLGTSQVFPEDRLSELTRDFIKHYYAGYHGNPKCPASNPPEQEIRRGKGFIQGLLDIWKDESRVSAWGRAFGELVRQNNRYNQEHQPFFNTDRNRYGDEFYRKIEFEKEDALNEMHSRLWERHSEAFEGVYNEYLRAEEKRFQAEHPDEYKAFLESRKAERARLTGKGSFYEPSKELLQEFDSDEARLRAFQKYFENREEDPVFDFIEWDQRLNPQAFDEEAIRL